MKLHELLQEGIEDRGIFKAIFFAGLPGAGKSYTMSKITSGSIQPRIVNTDKLYEFLAKQKNVSLDSNIDATIKRTLVDTSKTLNIAQLVNYLNGMLPLFIDGTSSNPSSVLRRVGILESLGYDVGMVWVDTTVETAIRRAQQRDRHVSLEYIKHVNEEAENNKKYYANKFSTFITINNNGELTDDTILHAYNVTTGFFNSPIQNPVGFRAVTKLQSNQEKYLVPSILKMPELQQLASQWYLK